MTGWRRAFRAWRRDPAPSTTNGQELRHSLLEAKVGGGGDELKFRFDAFGLGGLRVALGSPLGI